MHCFYNRWKCLQLHHGDGVQSEVALPDLLMASPSHVNNIMGAVNGAPSELLKASFRCN